MFKIKSPLSVIIGLVIFISIIFYFGTSLGLYSAIPSEQSQSWSYTHGCYIDSEGELRCTSTSYNIGDLRLDSSKPKYEGDLEECQSPYLNVLAKKECWFSNFTFDGKKYVAKVGEPILLNQYLSVVWSVSGSIVNGNVCHTIDGDKICKTVDYDFEWNAPIYRSTYTFFISPNFMSSNPVSAHVSNTIDNKSLIKYELDNRLTSINGGIALRQENALFRPEQSRKEESFKISLGKNTYSTEVSTSFLGDNSLRISPFIIVKNVDMQDTSDTKIYGLESSLTARTLPVIHPGYDKPLEIQIDKINSTQMSNGVSLAKDYSPIYIIIIILSVGLIIYGIRKK